jgi:hypothetical protein
MDAVVLADFRRTVTESADRLLAYSDADAARPLAPGKWSRKEIIGHLIDSAANNHARFVRAQLQDELVFDGYDQARWVEVQRYCERPWTDLVALWQAYNFHIASVMESADPAAVARPRARHNLDRIAMNGVSAAEPATLGYFMRDYVAHLKHHLRQALSERA